VDNLATNSDANITTERGDITIADADVEGDANIGTTEGNIGIDSLATQGSAGITTEKGDITIDDADVAGDASIGTTEGSIGIDSLTTQGNADLTTGTGDISINELVSKQSATLQTVDGAIDANRITADGMVEMFTQHGDITSDDKVVSLNDSVSVYAAKGDVDLNEVYAKQNASVGAGDGNVTVYTIDGENVIFTVEDRDKNLTADTVTAGDSIDITSNKTDFDTIIQRDDRDNMLAIAVRSPEADMPFEHLSIDHIVTKNGVIMSELWGDNIRIHVDAEKFYLPKLRIGKVGYFSTTSTSVTLYGIAPWLDSSNIQLWHDGANTDEWTSLMFLAPKRIATDAVYLNGDDWYDVYRQRRSGVDAMRLDLARENSGYRLEREAGRSADIYAPFIRYHLIDDSLWQADVPLAEDEDIVIEETI
ncbi:MAG: DUF4097 family beta strand repeat protein, partial [Selenomonadales bacterium]|nr:DUF4097 family beta strand repeat protein [Selenomonadales bacterium]